MPQQAVTVTMRAGQPGQAGQGGHAGQARKGGDAFKPVVEEAALAVVVQDGVTWDKLVRWASGEADWERVKAKQKKLHSSMPSVRCCCGSQAPAEVPLLCNTITLIFYNHDRYSLTP